MDRAEWLDVARGSSPRPDAPLSPDYDWLRLDGLAQGGRQDSLLAAPGASWSILQRVDDPDPKHANVQAQRDLADGATGLAIVFEGAPNAFGYGLPARPEALVAALHAIPLDRVHIRIDPHPASRASVDWMVEIMRRKRVDPSRINLSFGVDPTAIFAGIGHLPMSIEALHASMPQSLAHFFAMGIPAVLLEADGRVVHNAGATEAQELGVMLASAISHLRLFEQARQPLIYAVPHIGFAMATDQDQFLSIAKVLALRKLWRKAQESCALPATPARIHVETSYRMMTARDPETNILRVAMACFAAAAGGADSISALPHTQALGLPGAEARRTARNAQLIMAHESHLGFLGNPAAGVEDLDLLIATLCEAAWAEFRQIEAEGGLFSSLSRGQLQTRVRETAQERIVRFRETGRKLVGSTAFMPEQATAAETQAAEMPPQVGGGVVFCDPLPATRLEAMLDRDPA